MVKYGVKQPMAKKTILSASTTTGNLTLGNYIGAINNWTQMQDEYNCFYMVADLHSLTVYQDPKELKQRVLSFFAQYLACGLDPEKNVIFVQSQVKEHAELCWVLNCMTPMGALNRMTQFKEKSQKTKEINNGLYCYPVLMAADILLYQADLVPVGEDQKQHLEMTRDLCEKFNRIYKPVFKMPAPYIGKKGARIMSLQDPTKKMSKSDENPKNYVSIIDTPKQISKKIKGAMTDSDPEAKVLYDMKNKEGLANLMVIYSVLTGQSFEEIEKDFEGKMYGHFKVALADIVCEAFKPVQEEYHQLMDDEAYLKGVMKRNSERASERAQETLKKVYDALGLITVS
jgi:tryptophanyl-tRNA synthetase